MNENVFNPLIHRVVAVVSEPSHDDFGSHVHVSLDELMRDGIEIIHAAPDLGPVLEKLDSLERRPLPAVPDLQPIMGAVAELLAERDRRITDLERRLSSAEATFKSLLNIVETEDGA